MYSTFVNLGDYPYDPIERGEMEVPTRESSISTQYTFSKWIGDFTTPVGVNRDFYAEYAETPMVYNVEWFDGNKLLYKTTCEYGSAALYDGPILGITHDNTRTTIFKGWDKSTNFVSSDLKVYAEYETAIYGNYPIETTDWNAAQLYDVVQRNTFINYFADEEGLPNGNRIRINLGKQLNGAQSLITEPMVFDGTNQYDTGVKLLETDRN